jgi:hypothetical protein
MPVGMIFLSSVEYQNDANLQQAQPVYRMTTNPNCARQSARLEATAGLTIHRSALLQAIPAPSPKNRSMRPPPALPTDHTHRVADALAPLGAPAAAGVQDAAASGDVDIPDPV